jgi:hypothetical protein
MSKKAIATLNKSHPNYNLTVEVAGQNKAGQFLAKAILQVFDPKYEPGKQPTITKITSCYGIGSDEATSQDNAIEVAVRNLGL